MLLRSEVIVSERRRAGSQKPFDVQLELGEHLITGELEKLGIGRPIGFTYAPSYRAILTPVIESLRT